MLDRTSAQLQARLYKGHLLLPETPRKRDKAAVVKSCCEPITDFMVRVTSDPVRASITCIFCGKARLVWAVEVTMLDELGRDPPEGGEYVFAMPVQDMQRVLPIGHADASQRQVHVFGFQPAS